MINDIKNAGDVITLGVAIYAATMAVLPTVVLVLTAIWTAMRIIEGLYKAYRWYKS
jgi:hypothetical protein